MSLLDQTDKAGWPRGEWPTIPRPANAAVFRDIRIRILGGVGRSRALGHFGRGSMLHQTIQNRWHFRPARPNAIGIVGAYVRLGGCVIVQLAR